MLIFRWLCLTAFLYQYCVCHDSHSEDKNKVDKYLEILDELVEILEDLLQNIKSEFEVKNLSETEMNSGLTEGLDMRMVTTDPPGIVDSGVTISYNIENVFGTTPFVTSSETGPEIDGRDFSETTSPVINLTSNPFTLNTPSDNQSKLSSHLNYSLSNESSGTTLSSYLKTDDIVMTETPIGRFTSDITPKEIPLTTRTFLVSTTAEENDSTILVSNASTSEVINSTIFENEHESRDKRSAPENFNVSNEIDEILEAIKTELEEGELTEESFLKLEKYVKQMKDLKDLQSTKLNSSLIKLIIKDAKNLRKTIKIIVSARDIGKRSVPPLDFLKRPIILWGSVIVAAVFIAVIILLCLTVHCKVSNLSRKLDEIRSENTMQEESKNSATIFTVIPRRKNDTPKSEFGSKHNFSTDRIRNFEGPLNSTKLNLSRSTFSSSSVQKTPPRDYNNISLRRYDPETFEPIIPKVRYLEKNKKSLEF